MASASTARHRSPRRPDTCGTRRAAMAWIGLFRPDARRSSRRSPRSSGCTSSRSRTRSSPTSARSSSATATRCSWCCAPRRYLDDVEEVEFGEIHVFVGPNFVLTVRHSRTPDLGAVRHRMESDPELLAPRPGGGAVRDPRQRRRRLRAGRRRPRRRTSTRSRSEVFRGDPKVSRRIYELSRRGHRVPARDAAAATAMLAGARRRASRSTAPTRSCSATCATSPTTRRPSTERVDGFRQILSRHPRRSTRRS